MLLARAARTRIVAADLRGSTDELLDRTLVVMPVMMVMIMIAVRAVDVQFVVAMVLCGRLDGVGHGQGLSIGADGGGFRDLVR